MTIPVICDRCRVAGTAGTGDFSQYGDLLDFEPVPRPPRVDGWTAEKQRAFIALLATTGSQRRSAMALGMAPYGAAKLREAPGADAFSAAWDRAMAMAAEQGTINISTAVSDTYARRAQLDPTPSRLRGMPGDEDENISEAEHELRTLDVYRQYLVKVELERKARLAGKVVEADFILRQLTFFECALDLARDGNHIDTWTWLANLRRDGHGLMEIAQTPFSRFLDEARRLSWEGKMTGLDQPMPTPEEYLQFRDNYWLEGPECTWGGQDLSHQQQLAEQQESHRKAAMEQVLWEEEQRRAYEERQKTTAFAPLPFAGEGGSQCDPGGDDF